MERTREWLEGQTRIGVIELMYILNGVLITQMFIVIKSHWNGLYLNLKKKKKD